MSVPRFALILALSATTTGLFASNSLAKDSPSITRPVVAGFERFHSGANSDTAAGGRLLLGELNCTSCHQPSKDLAARLLKKQAPILDGIGSRVNLSFLRKFLTDPQAVKPGTTMPRLFAGLPATERKARVEELVHFLASRGTVHHTPPSRAAARRGDTLFHQVGCVACHGSQKPGAKNPAGVIPLGDPGGKYSVASLTSFLSDPLKTRPTGRMPNLNLTAKEATAIASHFLKDIKVPSNLTYKYYEGNWPNVPDFSKIKPKSTGGVTGFDLNIARRKNNFGMRFEGFLQAASDGEYTFFLGSDDGSKLFIDGQLVVVNDGIHPYTVKTGKTKLTKGPHAIIVDYTQGGGEWVLKVEYQGPKVRKQSLAAAVTSTRVPPSPEPGFKVNAALAARGRKLFSSVGCASCHQLREGGNVIASTLTAKPLARLKAGSGCTTNGPAGKPGVPFFGLNSQQRSAIAAAIAAKPASETAVASIKHALTTFNCYGCHSRGKAGDLPFGGPQRSLNPLFATTIKEMGDEGRVPPPLDGVGDKLTTKWLKHVMGNGANDRPYMLTHMPKFGLKNVEHLVDAFVKTDRKQLVTIPDLKTTRPRIVAAGRHMVGDKAFSCIKCHTFGKHKATGIQSLDLTKMTERIREDWFHRYMIRPIRYRPGTRMPTPFPGGISLLDKVLDGTPPAQLTAMWTYLKDGSKARTPAGLVKGKIPLVPKTEPILYRNFIQGLSPRGIGVGYPDGLNLAFDAERIALGLIWHGGFIDAAKHWQGRGQGFQGPLGDNIVVLPQAVPFATLERIDTAWPTKPSKELGYRFRGYRLNKKRQPVFRYSFGTLDVEDFPEPVKGEIDPSLKRTITLTPQTPGNSKPALVYLAASGKSIAPGKDGWYRIDNTFEMRVSQSAKAKPILRKTNGRFELLIPVIFEEKQAKLVHEYRW